VLAPDRPDIHSRLHLERVEKIHAGIPPDGISPSIRPSLSKPMYFTPRPRRNSITRR